VSNRLINKLIKRRKWKVTVSSSLETTFAGLKLRSPIGVGAIGRPEGANITPEVHAEVLLKHTEAGVGFLYMPTCSYASKESIQKVIETAKPEVAHPLFPPSVRFIRASSSVAPYGVEGMYSIVTHPCWMSAETDHQEVEHSVRVMEIIKKRNPEGVLLIANCRGYGSLPDTYVDAAKYWEAQGVDMIEMVFNCPAQLGMTGAVEDYYEETFSSRWPSSTLGQIPRLVENITREVAKAVKIPVGAKLTPEIGFPAIVGMVRRIREAGAKFISVAGCAVTVAPPDIYNQGKPIYPYVDGNAFAGATGSWLRAGSYKDVAAVARFVPGLDIAGSGGVVTPRQCVEMMMLGASMVMVTTAVIEQGRSILRRCNTFLEKYMSEQGYHSTKDFIGLGQQHMKYLEQLDMSAGKVKAITDKTKCTNCGICTDSICTVRHMEDGELKVDEENCIGCGICLIACRQDAIRLEKIS
jgi:dihydroorotate dehydrogenase/NAD-dependent dihydropyrimidine dehydrogenase PreA subunit